MSEQAPETTTENVESNATDEAAPATPETEPATATTEEAPSTSATETEPAPQRDEPANTGTGSDTSAGKDWEAEAEKWKALSRKNEEKWKTTSTELDKLRKQSDASKPEMARLAEQIEELRAENEANKRKALIAEVAETKGLTVAQAKRLSGNTKEELLEDAEDMVSAFGIGQNPDPEPSPKDDTPAAPTQSSARPTEKLRPGASGDDDFDPEALVEKAMKQTYAR